MRLRTMVMALALVCGLTAAGEAKTTKTHKVSVKKNHGYKQNRANKVKPRKGKVAKSHAKVRKG